MPEKRYGSAAERQAAYRARKSPGGQPAPKPAAPSFDRAAAARQLGRDPGIALAVCNVPIEDGVSGQTQFEGALYETRRRPVQTLEQCVERLLAKGGAETRREAGRRERIRKYVEWLLAGYAIGLIPANTLL